jgi:hypothetical protein
MTEQQLHQALSAANDLEPPADELFAQRALQRGRALTSRRRNVIVGAAAGVALVGVLGGTWLAGQSVRSDTAMSSGGAERAADSARDGSAPALGPQVQGGGTAPVEVPGRPGVEAQHTSGWVSGRVTEQTAALEELVPTLTLTYGDTFGGAYATDPTNTHIVVTLTQRHPELEALVSSLMPDPSDVSFELVRNTALRKQEVAAKVTSDAPQWRAKGVTIVAVRLDARADRVAVTVREAAGVAAIEQAYGTDVVRAEVGAGPPLGGTLNDPSETTAP